MRKVPPSMRHMPETLPDMRSSVIVMVRSHDHRTLAGAATSRESSFLMSGRDCTLEYFSWGKNSFLKCRPYCCIAVPPGQPQSIPPERAQAEQHRPMKKPGANTGLQKQNNRKTQAGKLRLLHPQPSRCHRRPLRRRLQPQRLRPASHRDAGPSASAPSISFTASVSVMCCTAEISRDETVESRLIELTFRCRIAPAAARNDTDRAPLRRWRRCRRN